MIIDKNKNMDKRELKYICIDFWGRPIFKDEYGNYFGNVEILFNDGAKFEEVIKKITENDIYFFGFEIDCDPEGTKIDANKIILVKNFKSEL